MRRQDALLYYCTAVYGHQSADAFDKGKGTDSAEQISGRRTGIYLSDEHLSVCLGEEQADVDWNQIIRVKDNGRELLVYMTAARAYIWPKDQLGEQYARVAACLKQHIDTGKLKLK